MAKKVKVSEPIFLGSRPDGFGDKIRFYNKGGTYHRGYHAGVTKEVDETQVPKKFRVITQVPGLKAKNFKPEKPKGASGKHGGNPCHDSKGEFC